MIFKKPVAGFALAIATVFGSFAASQTAHAQETVDFLWGGGGEWGGGRSTVSFDQQYKPGQLIVSFGDRRLYLVTAPGQALSYPIAIPREQSRWQGTTFVSTKRVNPSWTPTPDMVRENPRLPRWVPGGHPMNPLGVRALYLGSSLYRIHGTDAPWTIGQAVSKGCVRLTNEDVLDLYPRVPVGARVTVTWQRFSGKAIASYESSRPAASPAASARNTAAPAPRPRPNAASGNDDSYDPIAEFFGFGEPAPKPKPRITRSGSSASAVQKVSKPREQKSAAIQQ